MSEGKPNTFSNLQKLYESFTNSYKDFANEMMMDAFKHHNLGKISTIDCFAPGIDNYTTYYDGILHKNSPDPIKIYNYSNCNLRYFLSHKLSTCSTYTLYWPIVVNNKGSFTTNFHCLAIEQPLGGIAYAYFFHYPYVNLEKTPMAKSLSEVHIDTTIFSHPEGFPIERKFWMLDFTKLLEGVGITSFDEKAVYDPGAFNFKLYAYDPSGLEGYIRSSAGGYWR